MLSRSAIGCLLAATLAVSGCDTQSAAPEQANTRAPDEVAAPAASIVKPGAADRGHAGEPPPDVGFEGPDGKPVKLADFRGKPLLVNLWATWCAPCVAELPTLDAAAAAGGGRMTVLAVSQDMETAKVAPFLAARGLTHLKPFRDPRLGLSVAYAANLPTTIFYDANGRELWRITGGMDWTSAKAKALLAEG